MTNIQDLKRCGWCSSDPIYTAYHDQEWGRLTLDEQILFEFLVLESAQAGLSWITILKKREGYRAAFANFDVQKVAKFTTDDVERLMLDASIVRNRLKITTTITNAQAFIVTQAEFGTFGEYIRSFLPDGKPIVNLHASYTDAPVSSSVSDMMSRDMKRRGFKFFGTTICYAYLQAMGYIDDHEQGCWCRTNH